jgi:hypothetical protein
MVADITGPVLLPVVLAGIESMAEIEVPRTVMMAGLATVVTDEEEMAGTVKAAEEPRIGETVANARKSQSLQYSPMMIVIAAQSSFSSLPPAYVAPNWPSSSAKQAPSKMHRSSRIVSVDARKGKSSALRSSSMLTASVVLVMSNSGKNRLFLQPFSLLDRNYLAYLSSLSLPKPRRIDNLVQLKALLSSKLVFHSIVFTLVTFIFLSLKLTSLEFSSLSVNSNSSSYRKKMGVVAVAMALFSKLLLHSSVLLYGITHSRLLGSVTPMRPKKRWKR